jgi:hypothetical protein
MTAEAVPPVLSDVRDGVDRGAVPDQIVVQLTGQQEGLGAHGLSLAPQTVLDAIAIAIR